MIPSDKQIIIDNLLISYKLFSSERKTKDETLIFLHGWGSEKNVWNSIAQDLVSEGYECYSLDLPGFGSSQLPAKTFQISGFANIVRLFIEKFSLSNIVLIGHSFGGAVSIKLSTMNLSEVKKLVLVDNSGIRLKREKMSVAALGAKIASPIFKPKFMQPLRRKIYKLIGNEDYLDSGEMKGTYLNIIEEDLSPILSDVKLPTLIVWGEKDKDTPLWMGEKMSKEIRDSRFEILSGAGHYSFLERPEEFMELLRDFISN